MDIEELADKIGAEMKIQWRSWNTLTLREFARRLLAEQENTLLKLVVDIRWACGDEGKRMQPELIEYIRELKEKADKYQVIDKSMLKRLVTQVFGEGYSIQAPQQEQEEAETHPLIEFSVENLVRIEDELSRLSKDAEYKSLYLHLLNFLGVETHEEAAAEIAKLHREAVTTHPAKDRVAECAELHHQIAVLKEELEAVKGYEDEYFEGDMPLDEAIELAELWRAGKLIGGDAHAVSIALLKALKPSDNLSISQKPDEELASGLNLVDELNATKSSLPDSKEFVSAAFLKDMPNPSAVEIASPLFNALWDVMKTWDVNVPEYYEGYCSFNGSHAKLILDAVKHFAAQPVQGEPRHDDWIEWKGGECPVAPDTLVVVRYRDGSKSDIGPQTALHWRWQHTGGTGDIIAYKVVKD